MTALKRMIWGATTILLVAFSALAAAAPKLVELDESVWMCETYQAAVRIDNYLMPGVLKWDDERVQDYAEANGCGRLRVGTRLQVLNADTIQRGDVQVRLEGEQEEGFISEYPFVRSPFQEKLKEETTACTTVGAWIERMGLKFNTPRPGDIKPGQHCVALPEGTIVFKEPKTRFDRFYRVYLDDSEATQYWFRMQKK